MIHTETFNYDTVDFLRDEEDMRLYLESSVEDGDPQQILTSLGDISRALNMTDYEALIALLDRFDISYERGNFVILALDYLWYFKNTGELVNVGRR